MSAHTPGPWEWDGKFTVGIPYRDGFTYFRTNPIDARLIAAAPDLAQSVVDLLAVFRTCIGHAAFAEFEANNAHIKAARAALAKAGL